MTAQQNLNNLYTKPKNLFLLDGFGALLSAFLLGVVLVQLEQFFRIPKPTLYFLAALPCLFAMYDFYCYKKITKNIGFHLRVIGIVNILYCILSISLAFYHRQIISYLAWIYIILEIIIVLSIAGLELKVASKLINQDKPL